MKQPAPSPAWPQSWRTSYSFDLQEVYGQVTDKGYAYAYASRRAHALDMVSRAVPPPARVLDVAAAQGNFSLALAEAGYSVTWNDIRAELANYVALKHERGEIAYVPGNVFELDFSVPFDVVIMTEVIEHVAHPDEFLKKVAGLVRPGGHVVMTTPNGEYFRNTLPKFSDCPDPSVFEHRQFRPDSDGHIFLLHRNEVLRFAAEAGLEVLEFRYFTNPLTNGHIQTHRLLKILPAAFVAGVERATCSLKFKRLHVQMGVLLRKPAL